MAMSFSFYSNYFFCRSDSSVQIRNSVISGFTHSSCCFLRTLRSSIILCLESLPLSLLSSLKVSNSFWSYLYFFLRSEYSRTMSLVLTPSSMTWTYQSITSCYPCIVFNWHFKILFLCFSTDGLYYLSSAVMSRLISFSIWNSLRMCFCLMLLS